MYHEPKEITIYAIQHCPQGAYMWDARGLLRHE